MPCAQAMAALRAPLPQAVMEPTGDQERTTLTTSSTSGGSAKGEQTQHWPLGLPSSAGTLGCLRATVEAWATWLQRGQM